MTGCRVNERPGGTSAFIHGKGVSQHWIASPVERMVLGAFQETPEVSGKAKKSSCLSLMHHRGEKYLSIGIETGGDQIPVEVGTHRYQARKNSLYLYRQIF